MKNKEIQAIWVWEIKWLGEQHKRVPTADLLGKLKSAHSDFDSLITEKVEGSLRFAWQKNITRMATEQADC